MEKGYQCFRDLEQLCSHAKTIQKVKVNKKHIKTRTGKVITVLHWLTALKGSHLETGGKSMSATSLKHQNFSFAIAPTHSPGL